MASYPQSVLDEIRAAVDIVDVVNRFVNLKKAGQNWKGLCPFHAEKTPSFMVNEKKGIFHCFGCGVGGDAFGFLMRQDKLSFPEAVRALAKQAGVALPEERGPAGDRGREDLFRTMELAWRFYVDQLWKPAGDRAQQYLAQRGIDPEVARRFGLGLAPEGWDALSSFMRSEKVADDALVAAGLAIPREGRSGVYDRFRGRLLFAIRDLQGRVVAFGGRAFGDEQPKYLNSPETPLYTKGNLLYAADLARPAMQAKNRALLAEGYVDCLMAHQHGFTETVLRERGAAAFEERIVAARSLLAYALDRAIADPDGATGPRARTNAFARAALMLAKVADAQEAAQLSREAAQKLGVDATQLWIEAQRLQTALRRPAVPARAATPAATPPSVERDLVALLLHSTEAREALLPMIVEAEELAHGPFRTIVAALRLRPTAPAESLMTNLAADEARGVLAALLVEDRAELDVRVSIEQFKKRLERSQRLRRAREVSQSIADVQAKTGAAAPLPHEELRMLHQETAVVYGITGGVAQSLEPRTPGSEGAQTHE